jgi:hypothetical protein
MFDVSCDEFSLDQFRFVLMDLTGSYGSLNGTVKYTLHIKLAYRLWQFNERKSHKVKIYKTIILPVIFMGVKLGLSQ